MPHPVLIVEDETVVLNFARTVLSRRGHDVLTAGTVAEARDVLQKQGSSNELCLVIDVVLNTESGIAFAQEVVKSDPHRRVLLMSGFTDDVLLGEPELANRVSFLKKPFTKDELISAVDAICAPVAK